MGKPEPFQPRLRASVDAHKRHRLSHAHVQMARELGLNPAKLGNHQQERMEGALPLAVASGFLSNVRFSGDGRSTLRHGRAAAIACGLERRGNHVVVDPCDIRAVPLRSSYGIGDYVTSWRRNFDRAGMHTTTSTNGTRPWLLLRAG